MKLQTFTFLVDAADLDVGPLPEHRDHFEILSTRQVADHLNCSESVVRQLFRTQRIHASKAEGRWRTCYCDVLGYELDQLTKM